MTALRSHPSEGLRLDVLGRVSLLQGPAAVEGILAQPKRLALLVYIALRRPHDVVSRDELVGVFWPESPEDQARASLRQALRFVRSHLGGAALVNRGDAGVQVAPDLLACDALDFVRALDSGDRQRALDGYGGELLPGFLIAGAYEFDRWMHAERQRLRAMAVRAALELADEAESRGDLEEATQRIRWALEREPTDEAVARRLMSTLARAGNRGAAVAAYEALATRLADALDLEPSDETRALEAQVREGAAPDGPGGSGTVAGLSPLRVLVAPLDDLTQTPGLANLGRLAAEVMAQALAAVPELEVVPPMAVGGAVANPAGDTDREGNDGLPARLMETARRVGAGTVVGGTYFRDGDRLHLQVRLTDLVRGRLLAGPDPVVGSAEAPMDAIQAVGPAVATSLAPALTSRVVHLRRATPPPSMEAYTAYVHGLEHFIRGDWRDALQRLGEAAAQAPSYALPRIVQAIAHWNLEELPEARALATEAQRLGGSLGRFERAVLDMVRAWLDGDWTAAHAAARVQAELAPGSIPHFQVAEEARRLNRPREAREVLARLDPEQGELRGWIFYWVELAAAHHLLGDHARELELAHRCRRLHPDDPAATLLELRALAALGRHDDVVRLVEEAMAMPGGREPTPGGLLLEAALELGAHGGAPAARDLAHRAVAWYEERVGETGAASGRRELARALYHAGRIAEARALFGDLAGSSGGGVQSVARYHHGQLQAHLDEGYLAVIAAREGDEGELARWRRHLEELRRPFLYGAQWYWLAAVEAQQGQSDTAVTLLRRAFAGGLPHELFLHTDPHLARLRGHPGFEGLMRARG